MRILFLQPTYFQDAQRTDVYNIVPPLGLGYLTGMARRAGHEARVFDIMGRDKDLPRVLSEFPPDLIGVTGMTSNYADMAALCRRLRDELGYKGPLVAGGAHVTLEPKKSFEQCKLDAYVLGEADDSFPEILEVVAAGGELGRIKGLYVGGAGYTGPRPSSVWMRGTAASRPCEGWAWFPNRPTCPRPLPRWKS